MKIIDIIKAKYPDIQGVSYWHTQYDGSSWAHPYDGLVWANKEIPKPTKTQLTNWAKEQAVIDAVNVVDKARLNADIIRKLERIDILSIRAIRTGDAVKMAEWEAKAQALRDQMV